MTDGQSFRCSKGGRIDRSTPFRFTFNGTSLEGFAGDTLASALLANGIHHVSRSQKLHRPRGILSAGIEEPNALLGVDFGTGTIPLVRATTMPLIDNLKAESQIGFPTIDWDLGRILDFSRFLWPAGFYNKMMKWPKWSFFEWAVRALTGLGRLAEHSDPTRYRHMNVHCDVLVVGAGYAGLNEALLAAQNGSDVLLVEQDGEAGGTLLYDSVLIDNEESDVWLKNILQKLHELDNVRIMLSSTVVGYHDHNVLTIHDRLSSYALPNPVETYWTVRAHRVVLATGVIEQPLVFQNNDLPGIMLASAMHQYIARYGVFFGRRVLFVTNNDLAWHSMLAMHDAGVAISAVIDTRRELRDSLSQAAEQRKISVYRGITQLTAVGSLKISAVQLTLNTGVRKKIVVDAIAMSGGHAPTVHLYSQAGGKLQFDEQLACFVPNSCRQAVTVVGAASGNFSGAATYNISSPLVGEKPLSAQWVDFLHDVSVSDIQLAVRENYIAIEHLKRFTGVGMSVDQGKTSNLNAQKALAQYIGKSTGEVGTTTYRPMYAPVTLGAISGGRQSVFYAPTKRLSAHAWHASKGAVFDEYGGWMRPAYYGEDREKSISDEVNLVRNGVGLFDSSPLGKIEIKGPDAVEFLNNVYLTPLETLRPGGLRYACMMTEDGAVFDDGIVACLEDDHYLVNTTSGNADKVSAWFEEWHQCEWPQLDIVLSPVTTQWSVILVAGRNSRAILETLPGMADIKSAVLSHMQIICGRLNSGMPYRIQRVSYSGELSFELNLPSNRATEILGMLWEAGQKHSIGVFGIEALLVMRAEKGYLHCGTDSDGTTNAIDVGLAKATKSNATQFIGARSLIRQSDRDPSRRQLVGFSTKPDYEIRAGAHFVTRDDRGHCRSEGFVTSSYLSPTVGKRIGLGLLERGRERLGETVEVWDNDQTVFAQVVNPVFYDPSGERYRD